MRLVPLEELANVWPECVPWIESALEHGQGDENLWDIFIRLARGDYSLWNEPGRFAAVVQLFRAPRQNVAIVLYIGGEGLAGMTQGFEQGAEWCRKNGIQIIRCFGRPGWEKIVTMQRVGVILQRVV